MSTMKAPFNFVPMSPYVFLPDWANNISQDIPFEDGMSGSIDLKITNLTPIFVRNGHTPEDAEQKNDNYKSFSATPDGRYFIPSTSIKGCIRNVMEILSFGKMNHIDNKRYSIRDLQLKKYVSFFQNNEIHCGWMTLDNNNGKVKITDNGIPGRVSHQCIDEKFNTNFCDLFSKGNTFRNEANKSAIYKYQLAKNISLSHRFKRVSMNDANSVDKRVKVVFDESGDKGTIVFTGQPSMRKEAEKSSSGGIIRKASGKFFEFVFFDKEYETFEFDMLDKGGVFDDFKFIYKDSEEWKYWQKKAKSGQRIPVFFVLDNGQIKHFGLSYLYKLPFAKRTKEYLEESHKTECMDLSDCVFGCIGNKNSLKGRVLFTNAFLSNSDNICIDDCKCPYMASPNPTYYPIYLQQNGSDGYMCDKNERGVPFKTMLDADAKLKGWKRYPVRNEYQPIFNVPDGQEKNTSPFVPIKANSIFTSKVYFHNLRRQELGALLQAIQLKAGCLHSIGFAKSYGYGVCKIEIESVMGFNIDDIDSLKLQFIDLMNSKIPDYSKSSQLLEFYSMCKSQILKVPLEYMELQDFVKCKKQHFKNDRNQCFGEYLQMYSNMIKKQIQPMIPKPNEFGDAVVTVMASKIKQAKLVNGKMAGKNFPLEVDEKLKINERIEVEIVKNKGGNIDRLKFVKKI